MVDGGLVDFGAFGFRGSSFSRRFYAWYVIVEAPAGKTASLRAETTTSPAHGENII
jgi:hypothetical protein